MKNTTAKTLTLTAKKAPAKSAAQLAVPKTATSYFLETEAAAKVTVVKTRSRLAAVKTQAADEPRTRRQKIGKGVPIERPQERNRCLAKRLTQYTTPLDPAEAALSQASYYG